MCINCRIGIPLLKLLDPLLKYIVVLRQDRIHACSCPVWVLQPILAALMLSSLGTATYTCSIHPKQDSINATSAITLKELVQNNEVSTVKTPRKK